MKIPSTMPRLKGYRFPRAIVAYAVWAYHRFALSTGDVLDILVQKQRNAKAARRFLERLIGRFGTPRVIVTDKLRSYTKPIGHLAPRAEHRAHKGLNNRIEG